MACTGSLTFILFIRMTRNNPAPFSFEPSMIRLNTTKILFMALLGFLSLQANAQMITGVWKGKIDKKQVEIKIIQNGDSLTGTSYYGSANNYRRYSIKGYFDQQNNSAIWWDDQLIEEKGTSFFANKTALLSVADFNCPGGGEMYLDGNAAPKENPTDVKGPVDLIKVNGPSFNDEWDLVIQNYTRGTNDPDIIDSVSHIAFHPERIQTVKKEEPPVVQNKRLRMVIIPPVTEKKETKPQSKPVEKIVSKPLTIEEKFTTRKKIFTTEIPVVGDSIELRFYDNAEIDGDSISLFLNNKMIFTSIRLTDRAYTIKLSVSELKDNDELVMVAENLGAIPPNTSYMVAIVGDKRYEAKLASTENSSAMIRLGKAPSIPQGGN